MKKFKATLAIFLCLCLITPLGLQFSDFFKINAETQSTSGEAPASPGTSAPAYEMENVEYEELYAQLMSCTTLAEAQALLEPLCDEQLEAFMAALTEEQNAALDEHMNALIAQEQENGNVEYVNTVNFTDAAPLLESVSGIPTRSGGNQTNDADKPTGLELVKNAKANEDGTYTITLEAWVTGTVTSIESSVPTDIILVIDQSGSMKYGYNGNHTKYEKTTNEKYYNYFSEDHNLYYKADDNKFYEVVVEKSWNYYYYYYYYYDANGNKVEIGSSTQSNSKPDYTFYKGESRLQAMQTAVTNFCYSVAEKAKGADKQLGTFDDIKHRIAVVGFAMGSEEYNYNGTYYPAYMNTELFIGSNQYGYNNASSYYSQAFQNMNDSNGVESVTASINALAAEGGTYISCGLEMAKGIFNANPIHEEEHRNRVVVVFTDGSPGDYGYWAQSNNDSYIEANKALPIAKNLKASTIGATVYTVGIFDGADGSNPAILPSYQNDNNYQSQNANRFMHLLSSNYPDASKMDNGEQNTGAINPNLPNGKSYYLSAGDSNALNDVFQSISEQIGGTSVNLDSSAVIKDIISPYFTLPEGADGSSINVYTAAATSTTGEWGMREKYDYADVSISGEVGNQTISVNGFEFAENYVSSPDPHPDTESEYGKKLIIEFTVSPRPGFLGGNNVPTNTDAGIYENSEAQNPVDTFPVPTVNVPIPEFTVSVEDKNVYLLGSLNEDQLKTGASATANAHDEDVNLLGEVENWQKQFVDISTQFNPSSYSQLTADDTYTLTVTVSPTYVLASGEDAGAAEPKTDSASGKINVFKPVLWFKDDGGYYGQTDPMSIESCYTALYWKNGETLFRGWGQDEIPGEENKPVMTGSEPTVALQYSTSIENPIVTASDEVTKYLVASETFPVDVTVTINEQPIQDYTEFHHEKCIEHNIVDHAATVDLPEFYYHVNTCSITIDKDVVNAEGTAVDENQTFIFKVHYEGIKAENMEILPPADYNVAVLKGGTRKIVGLPVGTYIVTEDGSWSWRYKQTDIDPANGNVTLEANQLYCSKTVTVTNTLTNTNWLGDEASAVNVFDSNGDQQVHQTPAPAILPEKGGIVDGD